MDLMIEAHHESLITDIYAQNTFFKKKSVKFVYLPVVLLRTRFFFIYW